MSSLRWTYLFCFLLCAVCVREIEAAQSEPAAAAAADKELALDVVVTDKSGKSVAGLEQQDFTVLDSGQPQKIVSFRAMGGATDTPPVEVILLVDEVNTSFMNVSTARQQVDKFLLKNGGELASPVSVVVFSDSGTLIGQTASRDGKAVSEELKSKQPGLRTIGKTQGFYGAGERLQLSLHTLEQLIAYETPKPGRKLVIWVSPGWPLLSGPHVDLSSKEETRIFNSIVSLSSGLRRARITLYNVDPLGTNDAGGFRTFDYKSFIKPVNAAKQAQIGNLALQVLAIQSGGLVLNSNNDVAEEIAKCAADAQAFYAISFENAPGDGPNEHHALSIKVDKPGLTARTRTGYYAQPTEVTVH